MFLISDVLNIYKLWITSCGNRRKEAEKHEGSCHGGPPRGLNVEQLIEGRSRELTLGSTLTDTGHEYCRDS